MVLSGQIQRGKMRRRHPNDPLFGKNPLRRCLNSGVKDARSSERNEDQPIFHRQPGSGRGSPPGKAALCATGSRALSRLYRIAATRLANLVRRGNALKAVHELNFGNSTFGVSKF